MSAHPFPRWHTATALLHLLRRFLVSLPSDDGTALDDDDSSFTTDFSNTHSIRGAYPPNLTRRRNFPRQSAPPGNNTDSSQQDPTCVLGSGCCGIDGRLLLIVIIATATNACNPGPCLHLRLLPHPL
jgi:hypothetical protein